MRPDALWWYSCAQLAVRTISLKRARVTTEHVRTEIAKLHPNLRCPSASLMSGVMRWATGLGSGPLLKITNSTAPHPKEVRQTRHDRQRVYRSLVRGKKVTDLPELPGATLISMPPSLFDHLSPQERGDA
jgi:hypothetical protein